MGFIKRPVSSIARLLVFGMLLVSPTLGQKNFDSSASVNPGINDSWMSGDVESLVNRLERDSREIYRERKNLAALVGPIKGITVADVGAGSGFMVQEFSRLVESEGRVIAVDINSAMLERIRQRAQSNGLSNITAVLCPQDSINLPPSSVDLIFISDTYHHFEYPGSTLRSVHDSLKPGGQLVVVDFKRIPGESDDWVLEHVRAGEEVFRKEIEAAGFELINAHYPPFLKENYVLRFRRLDHIH